jgi:hypothetical protein
MSLKKKNRPLPITSPFVPLLLQELDSDAFLCLTGNAAKLLIYLKRSCRNAGLKLGASRESDVVFDYTYTEAKRRGFSNKSFIRAMKELWQKGFVSVVKIGGITTSEHGGRCNSQYKLTAYWTTYGTGGVGKWTDRTKFEQNPWTRSEP